MLTILVVEEFCPRYFVWEFPGTEDELVAEFRVGRSPFGTEYDQSMPPRPLPTQPDVQNFRGTIKTLEEAASGSYENAMRYRIDNATRSVDAVMDVRLDEENDEFMAYRISVGKRIGYIVPDLLSVPKIEGTMAAIQRGLICPNADDLDGVSNGRMPMRTLRWTGAWIEFHISICKACYERVVSTRSKPFTRE